MHYITIILMVAFTAWLIYRNKEAFKRTSENKKYIACTNAIFHEDEEAYDIIVDYMNNTSSQEFLNKAKVLKLYVELSEGRAYEETLNSIDFKDLFYDGEKVNYQKIDWNSDTLTWSAALIIKTKKLDAMAVAEGLMEKYAPYPFLNEFIEYNLCKSIYAVLSGDLESKKFLIDLIKGDYAGYKYDNRLIGIYKRIASAVLVYIGEELDEFEREDVYYLAKTKLGKLVLEDLGLFEEFDRHEDDLEVEEIVEEEEPQNEEAE